MKYFLNKQLLLTSVFVICTFSCIAQHYLLQSYSIKDGLSGNEPIALFQDSRGYLWISTEGGLSRFDGKNFKNYSMVDGMPSLYNAVCFEDNNSLWFSRKDGVCIFDRQIFFEYPIENKPELTWVNQLFINRDKRKCFLTGMGVWELRDSVWKKIKFFNDSINHHFNKMYELNDMSILFNLYDSLVIWKTPNDYHTIARPDSDNYMFYNTEKNHDKFYVSTWNHLYILKNEKLILVHDDVLSHKNIRTVLEDSKNQLWVGTEGNGIYVFDSVGFQHFDKTTDNLYGASSFLEDKEGNIWAASRGGGLLKVKASYVDFYDSINSINLNGITAPCMASDDKLFFAIDSNIFFEWNRGVFISHTTITKNGTDNRKDAWINQIETDSKNRLWLCNNQSQLFRYSNNKIENLTEKFSMRFGCLLIYNKINKCMYLIDANRSIRINADDSFTQETSQIYSSDVVSALALDSNFNIWQATGRGVISILKEKGKVDVSNQFNLSGVFIRRFFFRNKNTLWIATIGKGIYCFKNNGKLWMQTLHLTRQNGLIDDVIQDITFDNNNRLWVSTPSGLLFITFSNNTSISVTNLGKEEGFSLPDFLYSRLTHDGKGNVWYCANNYLACIHANKLIVDTTPPQIQLEDVLLFSDNNKWNKYSNDFNGFFHLPFNPVLPYDQNDLTFKFNAITFSDENNIEYSYKLEGSKESWKTAFNKAPVTYANIQPGNYVFKVRAKKISSKWSYQTAIFAFQIKPPYWQTWWFRTLIATLVATAFYGLYRFRLNQLLRLQTIRNKIAHDLHDDIGSTLNSISIFSQVAQQDPEKQKEALEMIGESSRKVIDAMSDIVWTINSDNDNFEKIIERMRSLSYNLFRAKNIEHTFKADESLNELKLSLEDRRNFYLIFKEAINNLVKYSEATLAVIELKQNQKNVSLTIRDNGKGFDASQEFNGNGLINMKSRAKEMDAIFMIDSTIGEGTIIKLDLVI